MITASSLSRLLNCPGSSLLSRAENASQWADAGQVEHADLASEVMAGTLPDWISAAIPPNSRTEVALAFDVATREGRIIGENLARAYSNLGVFEIVGSTDVLGVVGDAVVIADFKTGYGNVEPAATNAQLAFYALAAARALDKTRAIVRLIFTKTERVEEAELDAFDLAAFGERLAALHSTIAALKHPVSTTEGSWCRYCPSKHVCPSKNGQLVQLAERGAAVLGDSLITPERRRAAYEQFVRIEQIVADAKRRLDASIDDFGPIDLGNGRAYGRYHRPGRKQLDGDKAVQAIRVVVGESAKEFEALAIERSTSQAAIERAAKALAPARGASKLKAAVIAKIEELGGVTYGAEQYPIGEHPIERSATQPAIGFDSVDKLLKESA